MLVQDGGKGPVLGYWLMQRRGGFQKQSPLDWDSKATILQVPDPNKAGHTEKYAAEREENGTLVDAYQLPSSRT